MIPRSFLGTLKVELDGLLSYTAWNTLERQERELSQQEYYGLHVALDYARRMVIRAAYLMEEYHRSLKAKTQKRPYESAG